jgi:hypothetical protein
MNEKQTDAAPAPVASDESVPPAEPQLTDEEWDAIFDNPGTYTLTEVLAALEAGNYKFRAK